jgi:hypothetical protein
MKQAERLVKLMEVDAEIGRLDIRVKEAKGRLDAEKAHRAEILKGCTHQDGKGKPMGEEGMFGVECTICGEKDF